MWGRLGVHQGETLLSRHCCHRPRDGLPGSLIQHSGPHPRHSERHLSQITRQQPGELLERPKSLPSNFYPYHGGEAPSRRRPIYSGLEQNLPCPNVKRSLRMKERGYLKKMTKKQRKPSEDEDCQKRKLRA